MFAQLPLVEVPRRGVQSQYGHAFFKQLLSSQADLILIPLVQVQQVGSVAWHRKLRWHLAEEEKGDDHSYDAPRRFILYLYPDPRLAESRASKHRKP